MIFLSGLPEIRAETFSTVYNGAPLDKFRFAINTINDTGGGGGGEGRYTAGTRVHAHSMRSLN